MTTPQETSIEAAIAGHAIFAGLADHDLRAVAGFAAWETFAEGARIVEEDAPADRLHLIMKGAVALESASPGLPAAAVLTLGAGDFVGVFWIAAPYRWRFSARALEPVESLAIDAEALRRKCDADPAFGYAMMKRFAPLLVERLRSARMQALDLYGARP